MRIIVRIQDLLLVAKDTILVSGDKLCLQYQYTPFSSISRSSQSLTCVSCIADQLVEPKSMQTDGTGELLKW